MGHSDFYRLFSGYWWLIFPIGWGLAGLVRVWIRHREAQAALDVLKSYADQNREAPAELVRLLKDPVKPSRPPLDRSRVTMMAGLIFSALSVAFLVLRLTRVDNDPDNQSGLLFVVVLMAGFAVAFFIASYVLARDARLEKP